MKEVTIKVNDIMDVVNARRLMDEGIYVFIDVDKRKKRLAEVAAGLTKRPLCSALRVFWA